ncbi:MAG: hypothetical protein HYX78_01910 [Armatimonadetes bacterium]|nr:hypothetical protein [Armatimonadota bacterium]
MPAGKAAMSELISLSPRFLRSVHLERDFYTDDAAEGYLLTRGSLSALSLLARGTSDPSYRAQCISGPYGSGKSALALYFARLLDKAQNNGFKDRARGDIDGVANQLLPPPEQGYITILATGTRENIAVSLMRNLKRSLELSGRQTLLRALLTKHRKEIQSRNPGTKAVVRIFEDLARIAAEGEQALGVVVIVDELGKLLEYAALRSEDSDVQILQEMAEAASRSHDYPLWFVTILHQQFSQYASRLGRRHQREWERVQQRFFDVPCVLDGLDAFQLVARALNSTDSEAVCANQAIRQSAQACAGLAPRGSESDFEDLCVSCYPLHPTSLVLLPGLFRKYGQSERSLFSFLSANEPFSLTDWVRDSEFDADAPPFMRLPQLYDYACHTLVGGAPAPHVARAWAEVEEAIARLGDATLEEVDVLKSVGLLSLVGETSRFHASREALMLALSSPICSPERIQAALDLLEEKRLIVFRRFRNAFRLWEGSDVDVGERLAAAYQALPSQSVAVSVARDLCPSPPVVARRHSFRTGMLRSFAVTPSSEEDLSTALEPREDVDGRLIHCLVQDYEQRESVISALSGLVDPSVLVLVGTENDELLEAARDVAALEWVKHNTPALAGDRVARQELNERRLEAEIAFRTEWNRIFTPGTGETLCLWRGEQRKTASTRDLASLLSDACDATFEFAPVVQNELINRRRLSSAAAAARGNLVKAMLTVEDQPGLGFNGYPPERSIYESLLLRSGVHRLNDKEQWEFGRPNDEDTGLQKAWDCLLERAYSESLKPISVSQLFRELSGPPYGVADGFVPVLLCACMISYCGTMAMYEDGVFVPDLTPPVMERLMRRPENFSVLRFGIDGEREQVIERFARGFRVESGLLPVARSLYQRMGSLPRYVEMTRDLPPEAIAVREAILRAKSPERLIFVDLPVALGCHPFQPSDKESLEDSNVGTFFDRLNKAFDALIVCYPQLLERVLRGILDIFDVPAGDDWRRKVEKRASKLYDLATDSKLRALTVRAREAQLGDTEYLESLGAGIVGQPPSRWSKADADSFGRLVPQIAAQVRGIEAAQSLGLALEDGEDGYLLTISGRQGEAIRHLVRFSDSDRDEIASLVDLIAQGAVVNVDRRIALAALTEATKRLATADGSECIEEEK